ncbi:hypothetical protein GW17_00042044 [Ensete ventricosum]|nr:hypothetical protein GW17_00042044 [Ensete ventricosum]
MRGELVQVKSTHRVDPVGNLSGVCRELAEGIGSLLGWGKGVRQKKNETRRKIDGGSQKAYRELVWSYDGLRSSLGIGPGLDDAVGPRREFARRFAKGSGSSLGARRVITGRRPDDLLQECQRLSD